MHRALTWLFGAALLLSFTQPVANNDIGFHLRIGGDLLRSGHVPAADAWSFTAPGAPYVDQEWGSQALLWLLHEAGGPPALSLFEGLCVAGAFLALLGAMPGPLPLRLGILLLATPLAAAHAMARPHVLGWLLLAVLLRFQARGPAWRIPLLLVLWANLHASFALGVVLAAFHFLERRQWTWLAASLLAPLPNPAGWRLYAFLPGIRDLPLSLLGEFQPLAPDSPAFWAWTLYAALLLAGLAGARRFRPLELLRVGGLLALGFSAMRYPVVAALALAPLLAELWAPRFAPRPFLPWLLAGCILLGTGLRVRDARAGRLGIDPDALPVAATRFLLESGVEGPLFNDYNFGGYLLWKAWPRFRVFVDGRMDVYRGAPLDDYLLALDAKPGWEEVLDRRGIRCVLVRTHRDLVRALDAGPAWEAVYFDGIAAAFVRRGDFPGVRRLRHVTPCRDPLRPMDPGRAPAERAARAEELRYLLGWNPGFSQAREVLGFLEAGRPATLPSP